MLVWYNHGNAVFNQKFLDQVPQNYVRHGQLADFSQQMSGVEWLFQIEIMVNIIHVGKNVWCVRFGRCC